MKNLSQAEEDAISKLLDRTQELIQLGKLNEAEKFLEEILKYKPNDLNIPFQLGMILMKKGDHENAIEKFTIVYNHKPAFFENLNNLGTAYYKLHKYDDALFYYKEALEIEPDADFILGLAAACLSRRGCIDEAIGYLRRAVVISANKTAFYSDLLLLMIYTESISPKQVCEEAKKWGKILTNSYQRIALNPDKTKQRKLRIGYVSPDYRDHPVRFFLEPLLERHNKDEFEIYAYSNTKDDNLVMDRMKTKVDHWRDIRHLNVFDTASLISSDKIDILVDLAGHTMSNSLPVFAYKPAPIQITWLGFPATTGLNTIDYRITDSYAEPVGMTEDFNSESLWRLPHIFCCYKPDQNSPDVIDHPPFEDNGYITFGCFNNFVKAGDTVLRTWAKILEQVPNSRLMLEIEGIDDARFHKAYTERLVIQGISEKQIILEPRKKSNQFKLYNKIDIALDPFPCVGGTTSMDTLWMGVPFITLAGKSFSGRQGVSILNNAGLPQLIAQNTEEYVSIAVNLAKDHQELKRVRHNLRGRFSAGPAMNQQLFTQDMEDAYRAMWIKYCDQN